MKIACGKTSQPCKALIVLSILALFWTTAQGQPHQHRPGGGPAPVGAPRAHGPGAPGPGQSLRERWLAMPPAARQNFRRNAEIWMRMTPEQRNLMRQRENLRREIIKRESEQALRESGLHLSPQERALFEARYIQERRKVERALRQQIEAERQKEIPTLIQELKKEFQLDQQGKGPKTGTAESPKPKK
jgi:hypothetical protein